jgi:hypothetical protein
MLAHTNQHFTANTETRPFDIIYQAAKDKDIDKIKIALLHAASRGEIHTPVSKLAAEGNTEAVTFLRTHFNVSLHWIAYGLAQQKDRKKAADQTYDFLTKVKVEHPDQVSAVLKEIAKAENQIGGCTDKAIVLKTLATIDDSASRATLANELKDLM